jgi:Sulfotransferase family
MPGSPFTGSTLLGALLNELPDCASMGAAIGLTWRADLTSYRCSCGRLYRECEFWSDIAERTRSKGHPVDVFKTDFWNTHLRMSGHRLVNAALVRSLGATSLNRLRDGLVENIPSVRAAVLDMGWKSWSLASAVLAKTGKRVFVDTARDHQRPKYLARHPLLDVRVIHLVRDPRGNVASIMKHTGASASAGARQWKHYNREADRVRRYFAPSSWLRLHYEDLCADPAATLTRIASFLNVAPPTGTHQPGVESHIIGNKTRLRGHSEIREDRSWETRLTPTDLAAIARVAGETSHQMGYEWP